MPGAARTACAISPDYTASTPTGRCGRGPWPTCWSGRTSMIGGSATVAVPEYQLDTGWMQRCPEIGIVRSKVLLTTCVSLAASAAVAGCGAAAHRQAAVAPATTPSATRAAFGTADWY